MIYMRASKWGSPTPVFPGWYVDYHSVHRVLNHRVHMFNRCPNLSCLSPSLQAAGFLSSFTSFGKVKEGALVQFP